MKRQKNNCGNVSETSSYHNDEYQTKSETNNFILNITSK